MNAQAQVIDITPGTQEAAKALTVSEQAKAVTITDKVSYEYGRELLLIIKDLRKEIADTFKPIIDKANQAHKEAIAQQKKVEAPLIEAEGLIKTRIAGFLAEEDRKRRAEEDRLRLEAQKAEEERRLAEALQAEAEGDHEEAAAILNDVPAYVPPVVVPKTVQTGRGISLKTFWTFKVVDAAKIPREYLVPDLVKIGGVVRAMKDAAKIPGVEIYSQDTIAAGRR
jgi:hypothetical protein